RTGTAAEHDLQAALEGEHLAVEAGRGDDVGQEVLDVVQLAGLTEGVGERGDLLLEEELLFVVKHGAILAGSVRGPAREPTGAGEPARSAGSRSAHQWPFSRRG